MPGDFERDLTAVQGIDAVPRILAVVCGMTGMGFAAVARVTSERWVALAVRDEIKFGLLPGGELKVETTICSEIRDAGLPVVIDNVDADDLFCVHPTPKLYGFQSYISVPIVLSNGRFFGTLCAIDPKPRTINTPEVLGTFKLFAELIAFQLDAIEKLSATQADLIDERKNAELREQFIAVLGHDLRNPLASVDAGARILLKRENDEQSTKVLRLMQTSVQRMSGLIDNVLDFARGRLGGGLALQRDSSEKLGPVLVQVIAELQSSNPDRTIDAQVDIDQPFDCDSNRIGQLASNLVGNALMYGTVGSPIHVRAATESSTFVLSVANAGTPIPAEAMERLFHPFKRGAAETDHQGLGLGLYIASEIAKAHGGRIDVVSTKAETRFTFTMPI
ncbi:MAG: GAF domain-containing sensor histidine kinase [Pseudolabrys sp.]|nr:GAF domain-containing sensor histidine kinase [Pseudolabrys sp.]